MFTYADPRVCPSCREPLPQPVSSGHRCTTCEVPVGDPRAGEVFVALQRVDTLVESLRALAPRAVPVPDSPSVPVPVPQPLVAPATDPTYPVVPPLDATPRTGVRTSSVPAILLGLGALCLLVAAVIFLAVAWGWLGVGGRTAVLAALTVAAGGGGLAAHVRGLRIAGEALATVALGLLVLDVLGANGAGWIGGSDGLDGPGLALTSGLVLAVAGALLSTVRASGADRLAVPQVVAVLGLFLAQAAVPAHVDADLVVAALSTVGLVALALATRRGAGLHVATWTALAAASLTWLDLTLTSLVRLDDLDSLTVTGLWTSAGGAGLLTAALLLLAPLAVHRDEALLQLCLTASATMTTGLVALPAIDDGATAVGVVSLALGALWTAAAYAVPRARLAVPSVPAALSLVPVALVAVVLAGQALASVLDPALDPATGLVLDPTTPVASPALLVLAVVVVSTLVLALAPSARGAAGVRVVLAALALAGVAALALQPVPLWSVVAALALLAAAYGADTLRRSDLAALVQLLVVTALLMATLVVAGPSTGMMLVPLTVLVAVSGATFLVGRGPGATEVGGLLLPLALAGLTWVLGDLAGLDGYRAVPVLVVLAAVAIARPRLELEVATAAAGALAALTAVPLAADGSVSLALHLTLAGALLVAHSLVHPTRRPVAVAGTALLVLATWVRLADLGVQAPEPYTMPTAVLLVAFGLHRMRRDASASTALTVLPGLVLATVPSFLQVLATDPVSVRAALLGLGCLLLTVGGAQLRWSAPLLVGAVVGGLLVLVELAPYAVQTPQWVVIGLAGTTLVAVGVTWERRVLEVQRAAQYVGRLR